jgi:tagaturonate reductase
MKSMKEHIKKIERPIRVIQFGTGNFLRGFADWMIEIMNETTDFNSSVHVVQIHGKSLPKDFIHQNYNYHILTKGIKKGKIIDEKKIITCISGATNANLDYNTYLNLAKLPDLQFIISNTTEAGIIFDKTDVLRKNEVPATFPGKLTALLNRRFEVFKGDPSKGLVMMPCELIDKNGFELKSCILKYAELWKLSKGFIEWIGSSNIFCNTLVDRIVPGFPKDQIEEIQASLDYEDKLVVTVEPFHLWVIEGPFSLEKSFPAPAAGLQVKFVNDQSPYRTRKVRILNGTHTAMVPIAYLGGFITVREAMEDPKLGKVIDEIIFGEIIPTLDLPQEELIDFAKDVVDRFRNPYIRHELISIALNSVSKFKVRVLPSLLEYKKRKGFWPKYLTLSFAALIQFYSGKTKEETIPLKDNAQVLEFFKEIWKGDDLNKIVYETLRREDFWGEDLSKKEGLAEILIKELQVFQSSVKD